MVAITRRTQATKWTEKTMKVWTIAMLVLGVIWVGFLGAAIFNPSPTWSIVLTALIAVIGVIGIVGPIVNRYEIHN